MTYRTEMGAGHEAMARRQWSTAYQHFHQAHDLGHAVRGDHLAAHRSALRAAVLGGHPAPALYQAIFLAFAALTSW
jgi:hypothetical protein